MRVRTYMIPLCDDSFRVKDGKDWNAKESSAIRASENPTIALCLYRFCFSLLTGQCQKVEKWKTLPAARRRQDRPIKIWIRTISLDTWPWMIFSSWLDNRTLSQLPVCKQSATELGTYRTVDADEKWDSYYRLRYVTGVSPTCSLDQCWSCQEILCTLRGIF